MLSEDPTFYLLHNLYKDCTGQNRVSPVCWCITVSSFVPFFLFAKLRDTLSTYSWWELGCFSPMPALKNWMSFNLESQFIFPCCWDLEILARSASKKYVPIASSLNAVWVPENLILASSQVMTAGRACCCVFFGSLF